MTRSLPKWKGGSYVDCRLGAGPHQQPLHVKPHSNEKGTQMKAISGTITAYPGVLRRRSASVTPGPSEATWTVPAPAFATGEERNPDQR